MVGFLKTIETAAGQTIGVIRENGQVEDCSVVDPSQVAGGPLTALWFVDRGAAAGGTGSIGAPFDTFAGAIAAAQADFTANNRDQTIVCVPGDYSGEALQTLTLAPGRSLTLSAWVTPVGYGGVPVKPWLPQVALPGVGVGLYADGVSWPGVAVPQVDVSGDVSAVGCFIQSVNCDRLRASLSQIVTGTMITSAEYDQTLLGTGFTCPISRIRGIRQTAAAAFTGDVELDAYSNNGQITASGTLKVVGHAAQEVVSVVVPAVGAGNVGYVDTNFVAGLAGVGTDTPITGNPSADLVAAGAGGGFINCRVSAPGVVRCAFVGPLAGGASFFTFASLSYP